MKYIGTRTIKTGIGAMLAITIALSLGLRYATAAGIITILSIQNTKRQSMQLAAQRFGACILALFISAALFKVFGFSTIIFGIFLIIFIPLSAMFKLNEGIVVSSVLVTHILVEKSVAPALISNELALMLIGIAVALLLNLYMPSIERRVKEDQVYIEECIREVLRQMSTALKSNAVSLKEEELFRNLENRIRLGRERAYRNLNNTLFSDNSYYVKYMDMRNEQLKALKNMRKHFEKFSITYKQTLMIADFTSKLADSIHEYNTAEGLLKNLQQLRESFTVMELPKTREEFENRAMLLQFINDLEQFLIIKNEFKKNLKEDSTVDVF